MSNEPVPENTWFRCDAFPHRCWSWLRNHIDDPRDRSTLFHIPTATSGTADKYPSRSCGKPVDGTECLPEESVSSISDCTVTCTSRLPDAGLQKEIPLQVCRPSCGNEKEIHLTLTMYSTAILLAYGFFVFGIFLAFVFTRDSFHGLVIWTLYLVPHGVIETLAMIMAMSTGIVVRDSWLKNFDTTISSHWRQVSKRDYASCLVLLIVALLLSAFLEVYVSRDLMRLLANMT